MLPEVAPIVSSRDVSSDGCSVTEAPINRAPKIPLRQKLVQIVIPQVPKFEIPSDTQQVILGIPGFLCTKAALKPGIQDLNRDGIVYLDWGEALDFGFTNRIIKHVDDYVKAITEQFGDQISVHGNSLGGFLAYFAAYSNPLDVKRLILTASPHLLTLDPKTLSEHTNIAPFIGLMNNVALARFMSKDTISLWEHFRSGVMDDEIKAFWDALEKMELLIFAAAKDTTVRGRMCLTEQSSDFLEKLIVDPEYALANKPGDRPNVREFVVPGDHVDVFKGATSAIRHLATRDLQAPLPDEIQSDLLPIEAVEELVRRSPRNVAWDFTRSSLPSISLSDALHSTVNAPATLLRRFTPGTSRSGPALELERPLLSPVIAG